MTPNKASPCDDREWKFDPIVSMMGSALVMKGRPDLARGLDHDMFRNMINVHLCQVDSENCTHTMSSCL